MVPRMDKRLPRLVGTREVAKALGVPSSTVRAWAEDGTIPAPLIKRPKRWFWAWDALEDWIERARRREHEGAA